MGYYKQGESTRKHRTEVQEICNLRKSMGRPCFGCQYENKKSCPKAVKNNIINNRETSAVE